MGILIALIIPLPTSVLDVLLVFNISLALLLLVVVMSVTSPRWSSPPSRRCCCIGTLFRLALNVACTRLILLNGYAGDCDRGVRPVRRRRAVGGRLVVFLILVVIQFIVITKGAERIAEVAARFTLDAMPGKQMSIDADLNAGLIDEQEARRRREEVTREADFYGAMDGASKFVRGDAIAGIIIVVINIVGGIIIGLTRGMTVGDALHTYALLTVGDGLVTQIPALIISTSAGILITKSATNDGLAKELGAQLFANPRAIGMAAVIISLFGIMPGLPMIPFFIMGGTLGGVSLSWCASRTRPASRPEPAATAPRPPRRPARSSSYSPSSSRTAYPWRWATTWCSLWTRSAAAPCWSASRTLRKRFARELGVVLPKIRIVDNVELDTNTYRVKLPATRWPRAQVHPGWLMAMKPDGEPEGLNGIQTTEPSFGLPVVWISRSDKDTCGGHGLHRGGRGLRVHHARVRGAAPPRARDHSTARTCRG